jgi:hypothetical protein
MVTREAAPNTSAAPGRYHWLRTICAASVAVLISLGVSFLGRSEAWPHWHSIGFASLLFQIPVMQSALSGRRPQKWTRDIAVGLILGLIGGLVYTFWIGE